jgi:hypothetical protein
VLYCRFPFHPCQSLLPTSSLLHPFRTSLLPLCCFPSPFICLHILILFRLCPSLLLPCFLPASSLRRPCFIPSLSLVLPFAFTASFLIPAPPSFFLASYLLLSFSSVLLPCPSIPSFPPISLLLSLPSFYPLTTSHCFLPCFLTASFPAS